nr:RHS repeat-associated core domain-containing protein [Enterobacter cancerogenus]
MTHTHAKYPQQTITLKYDADGRMTTDEAGRTLNYDATGRLISVSGENISGGTYGYDALNRLVRQDIRDTDSRQLYYRDNERVSEIRLHENQIIRLIKSGHTCLGVSDDSRVTLTASDRNDSLLWSRDSSQKEGNLHAWSPYGSGNPTDLLPGFDGERADPVSGTYHLGNGYRAYNPVLMRFNCPDNLSPFGAGGINPYAYCAGDPINQTDPSGHISWQGILGIVTGVIGIGLAIFTAGASVAAASGVLAAISAASVPSLVVGGLGVVADATAIASGATEDVNPQASSILGWISLGTGLVGAFEGGARLTYKGAMRASAGIRQRAATILEVGLSGRGAVKAGRAWAEEEQHVMTFFRADDRAPTEIKKYGGFTARSADSRENILSRFKKAFSEDAAGHSQAHVRQGNPDYISFGTDLESGGYAETRSHLYEVKIKGMKVTDITGDTMGTAAVRKGPKVSAPRLLLSGDSVDTSEFVAMMPARTVEATFITPVPLQNITRYRYMGIWHTFT